MEDVLNIPGSIHSISQEGNAVYADEVFDKIKNKKQQLVNQETDEALEAQNQRVATLEEAVGEGGSVDERIAQAKSEAESDIKGGASSDYDTLKKTEDAIKAEVNAREGAVSDEASARQDAINTAKTEIIGGASTDCNTLGKAEIKISTNAQDIAQLQAAYEALTQSTPVIVEPTDTWPVASPEEGVIYRVIDRVNTPPQNYSDYMYNGTAMVLMATYDNAIDDIPTPGSNNLVKSGGVASHIVYDISEANAVGSTLATYADLAAALGNNGANIPPSIQKGGMSVKFVQSSDNKYAQYRLMSDSFNTTIANWQGVDEEPVAGSANLVKSGGVAKQVGYKVETDFTLVTSSSKQTKRVYIDNSKNISAAIYFNGGITTNNNHIKVALYKDALNAQGFVWESDYFGFNETISYEGQNDFNILVFEVYPNVVATAGDAQIVVNTGLSAIVNQNTEKILSANNATIQQMYFAKNYVLNGGITSDDNGIVIGADIIWADGVAGRLTLSSWNDNACEYAIETATHSTTSIVYSKQFNIDGSLTKETITIS